MNAEEESWYWDGVLHGLRVAKVIISQNHHGRISDIVLSIDVQTDRIESAREKRHRVIVDGEAEWRSWMIELEMQSWDRSARKYIEP